MYYTSIITLSVVYYIIVTYLSPSSTQAAVAAASTSSYTEWARKSEVNGFLIVLIKCYNQIT